jgi:hypothetical protein
VGQLVYFGRAEHMAANRTIAISFNQIPST